MATYQELDAEWSNLCQDCTDCWTNEDLQLAAELGKTLLERNRELETSLRQHQTLIDDQTQEIEYLTKQTVALREVSDSRLRIYEQLEVSIQDLERTNHRLGLENSASKKHIRSLTANVETLEGKCEELQTTIDDLRLQIDCWKRRTTLHKVGEDVSHFTPKAVVLRNVSNDEGDCGISCPEAKLSPLFVQNVNNFTPIEQLPDNNVEKIKDTNLEQISVLLTQVRESKTQTNRDQRRITELEEQLATIIQQNQVLENQIIQLHHRDDDMKSMYDELSTLEEVRKGQMCSKCLRDVDQGSELQEDDDDSSLMANLLTSPPQHRSSFTLDVQERPTPDKETGSLYKNLVEKYEALLEVHRQPSRPPKRGVSLQEEFQQLSSGDFVTKDNDDEESGLGSLKVHNKAGMTLSHTPTDFSEAETSSSGFSDETSTKSTQTDDLCGEEPFKDVIERRFKNQPEYHELFKEIFHTLKYPPELISVAAKPQQEALQAEDVIIDDDCQSMVSSTMSELSVSQMEPSTVIENIVEERILRPLVKQPLEYLSVEVRKRSSSRRKSKNSERSDSPVTHIIGSPKIQYSSRPSSGRKKRDFKLQQQETNEPIWNGNTVQFWSSSNRNIASPTPSQSSKFEFRPSVASQELHKLKKLDLSYAEVVRKADCGKKQARHHKRK